MTGRVVDLNRERWLALANQAAEAAGSPTPARYEALRLAAGRMVSATPPATEAYAMSLCLAFRWTCTAYATAPSGANDRQAVRQALRLQVDAIRSLFDHVSPPSEPVSAPVPSRTPLLDAARPEHPWMRRADIGGA